MNCERCGGLMVVEDCLDFKGSDDGFWIKAMRCIMCGNLMDPMIARHRKLRPPPVVAMSTKKIRRAPRTPVARLIA